MTVRQPISYTRFTKAASVDKTAFEQYDINHVRDKFPEAEDFLSLRLGKAITRRRRYLTYRENHQQRLEHNSIVDVNQAECYDEDDGKSASIQPPSTMASSLPENVLLTTSIGSKMTKDRKANSLVHRLPCQLLTAQSVVRRLFRLKQIQAIHTLARSVI
jgi:hypothetical protein